MNAFQLTLCLSGSRGIFSLIHFSNNSDLPSRIRFVSLCLKVSSERFPLWRSIVWLPARAGKTQSPARLVIGFLYINILPRSILWAHVLPEREEKMREWPGNWLLTVLTLYCGKFHYVQNTAARVEFKIIPVWAPVIFKVLLKVYKSHKANPLATWSIGFIIARDLRSFTKTSQPVTLPVFLACLLAFLPTSLFVSLLTY